MIAGFLSDLSDAVFPPLCPACSRVLRPGREKAFCGECRKEITYLTGSHCPVCGVLFTDSPAGDHWCGACIERTPHYTLARSALTYDGAIADVIHQFKYGGNLACGAALAVLLADCEMPDLCWSDFDVIVPVPLHVRRLRKRGFNQSLILARALGKKHGLQVDFSLLKRHKFTLTQTGLGHKERELNIKGAFDVPRPENVTGQNMILVDDVLTTGATVNECAKTLKKAGARRVAAVTLARVRKPRETS